LSLLVASQCRIIVTFRWSVAIPELGDKFMIRGIAAACALCALMPAAAMATSLDKQLDGLTPEFRSHQLCILRGLETLRRAPQLRKADRMKTSIFSPALLEGTKLTANGGAVRASGHWYSVSFTCDLTSNWMKATSFSYVLGQEIPEGKWEDLGLWR